MDVPSASTAALVALGGAAGALARWGVGLAIGPRWPGIATLVVNVAGAAALGALVAWTRTASVGAAASAGIGIGALGAFTTFSTLAWEVVAIGRAGGPARAGALLGANVVLGVAAAWAGHRLVAGPVEV